MSDDLPAVFRSLLKPKPDPLTPSASFAEKAAIFRAATGKTETCIVPCRCAVTGKPFMALFERADPGDRFRVLRIDRQNEDGSAGNRSGVRGPRSPAREISKTYDAHDFSMRGLVCPWCGDHTTTVICSDCGETVCGGRVRTHEDGRRTFVCHDGCGRSGTLGPAASVYGRPGSRGAEVAGVQTSLPAPGKDRAVKKLPHPPRVPLLPGMK